LLFRKEEVLLKILWRLDKAFIKDITEQYCEPKPHYNTFPSLVRLLQYKGIIGFTQCGNTCEYYPIISRYDYRKTFINQVISGYLDNSCPGAVAFFVKEKSLKPEEMDEIFKVTTFALKRNQYSSDHIPCFISYSTPNLYTQTE
jgi:predicted transcriptional regulator